MTRLLSAAMCSWTPEGHEPRCPKPSWRKSVTMTTAWPCACEPSHTDILSAAAQTAARLCLMAKTCVYYSTRGARHAWKWVLRANTAPQTRTGRFCIRCTVGLGTMKERGGGSLSNRDNSGDGVGEGGRVRRPKPSGGRAGEREWVLVASVSRLWHYT